MNEQKRKVTVVDIARAAGVALGTVSRVLNNHPEVNDEMRNRVLETARDLNYTRIRKRRATTRTPSGEANGAASGNIAVICFGMEDALVQLPVVSSALQGIEHALASQHRDLMFANVPDGDRVPAFLRHGRVDGLILKGPNQGRLPVAHESELLRHIYQFPRVWLMGRLPNAQGDHCNFDFETAARLVAEHVAGQGHRHVAFFNPKPGQVQFERLKMAFFGVAPQHRLRATLLETEPPARLSWPLPAITLETHVEELVERWANLATQDRPTTLFTPSDRTAVQLYASLARRGLKVGQDVSVVSCNNERSLATSLHPALTTIDVHPDQIGRRAIDLLLWRIAHTDDPHPLQIFVDPTLVVRESVARF
jgi:DNA-binding LacI/PurR family transcriptional regulator